MTMKGLFSDLHSNVVLLKASINDISITIPNTFTFQCGSIKSILVILYEGIIL